MLLRRCRVLTTNRPALPFSLSQEARQLQAKQRRLEADLQDSRAEVRAAAAQQEQVASLAAELAAAQREAAAATEQLRMAHSRGATLEQAYAAAVQVGGWAGLAGPVWCCDSSCFVVAPQPARLLGISQPV